jgi:hypothetical protein
LSLFFASGYFKYFSLLCPTLFGTLLGWQFAVYPGTGHLDSFLGLCLRVILDMREVLTRFAIGTSKLWLFR